MLILKQRTITWKQFSVRTLRSNLTVRNIHLEAQFDKGRTNYVSVLIRSYDYIRGLL